MRIYLLQLLKILPIFPHSLQILILLRDIQQQLKIKLVRNKISLSPHHFLLAGWEIGVDRNGEQVIQHVGDQLVEEGAADVDAGVGVALDEPDLVLPVNHEVQPEQLELLGSPPHHQHPHLEQYFGQLLHFLVYLGVEPAVVKCFFEVFVHVLERDLVCGLVPPVVL